MSSRLFVQNLPKKITEKALREHFSKFGTISDLKIVSREKTNRRFCFLGFKTDEAALKTKEYFDKTYIMTSKISIDFAKTKDDPTFSLNNEKKSHEKFSKEKKKGISNEEEIEKIEENKKRKFKELLSLMKAKKGETWNDNVLLPESASNPIKKQKKEESIEEVKEEKLIPLEETQIAPQDNFIGRRLFVLNLPFDSTEEDVKSIFSKFGEIENVKMPIDSNNKFRGFAYVTFSNENEALHAFSELDNAIVHGRILHLKPAEEKPNSDKFRNPEFAPEKSSFKKFSKEKRMKRLQDTSTWNTLFLNPNSIVNEICSRFEIKKVDLFAIEQENLPAKIAMVESKLIAETKEWMSQQGLDLSFLEENRGEAERSKRVLIVKNLHTKASPSTLSELFGRFGKVEKALVAPNGVLGIVVMANEEHAQNAFQNLSYFVFKHEPLYLEFAPVGMIEEPNEEIENPSLATFPEADDSKSKILFIKNLNFSTEESDLSSIFSKSGEILKVKIPKDSEGKSKGFGFIEFREANSCVEALKKFQGTILHSHSLQLSVSIPKPQKKQKRKQKELNDASTKLLIKNLAFEASKNELKELLVQFGELKSLRIPKKMDNTHRFEFLIQRIRVC